MKKFLSKIKWFWLNNLTYSRKKKYKEVNKKKVYFALRENPYDRYLYLLFLFFEITGYSIYVKRNFGFLSNWSSSLIFKGIKDIHIVNKKPKDTTLSITDQRQKEESFDFILSPDYFQKEADGHYIPMPMVDTFYVFDIYKKAELPISTNCKSKIKIFFAGRFNEKAYDRKELKQYFNHFNRLELLSLLHKNFKHEIQQPKDLDEIYHPRKPIIIVDRDICNIPPPELPGVLSSAGFFLAFPGVVMPLCHNIVEAMASGLIPILQYHTLFHPALEPGKNCLGFNDEQSFKECVVSAMHMDFEEIMKMKENVLLYYNEHLHPESVVRNIVSQKGKKKLLLLNAEYQSVQRIKQIPSI